MTQTAELIGAPEAARILGVDRSTVTRWVKAGRLHPVQQLPGTNGALVFDGQAVRALVQDGAR